MTLSPGSRLGPYEILAPLGAGGMGEVYKARDTRLDRTVAIKVLPPNVASNPELRQRFEREAKAVSSLNHPHICTLHDIGRQDGVDFLVMEYLEGETLAARLAGGPLPLDQALRCAVEIADALAQAHRQGVFHRDLKPANIMLTRSGAKLLDFGLAKLREAGAKGEDALTAMATMSQNLTEKGTILGTLQYMAPEQLEGKDADARTDLFAFGAVVYEMVTGRKAFAGRSHATLISSIMTAEPPSLAGAQPMVPPALDHVVRRCLAKEPEERWQTAQDVLAQLKWIAESGSQAGVPQPVVARRKTRALVSWALLGVSWAVAGALAVVHFSERPAELQPVRFTVSPPAKFTFPWHDSPTISPDGRQLVFAGSPPGGGSGLWLRSLHSLAIQRLPGTDGAALPFWSPDSRSIAFFADGKLKRIDLSGGPARTLADARLGMGGAWNRDAVILFSPEPGAGLHRVAAAGGEAKPWLALDGARQDRTHSFPRFLPDGRHFLFAAQSGDPARTGIYLGSLESQETRLVIRAESSVGYSPPGLLLFARQDTLLAQPFDVKKLQPSGEAFPVAEQIGRMPFFPGALFSVSDTGVLAYRRGIPQDVRLVWYSRDDRRLGPVGEPGDYRQIALSPDERRVAVQRLDPKAGTTDLWILDLSRGIFSRLTLDPESEHDPVWSPDGREVLFSSTRKGPFDLFRKTVGGGQDQLVLESGQNKFPEQWLKDGSILFIGAQGKSIHRLPPSGERKPEVLAQTEFERDEPKVSPDGRWVSYNSNESGRWEVYVAAFPGWTERRQVSNAGGVQALWRRDGRELFYLSLDGELMAVDVQAGKALETGVPKVLFETRIRVSPVWDQYAAAGDGQRFLVAEPVEQDEEPMNLVLNWTAELKR